MIKRKILLVLLSFGLVFSNVLAEEIVDEKYVGSETETVKDAYTDLTKEEAEKKKSELEKDDHDYKVTVEIRYTGDKKVGEDKITINKTFNSKDEAQAYLDGLVKQGYKVSNSKIIQKETTTNVSLKETFNTLEEAEKALDEFKKNNDVKDSDVKITKVRNESKDTTSTVESTKYDNIDDANKAKEALAKDADGYEIYGEVRIETINGTETKKVESEQFDNRQDALDYIQKLKNEGWDVSGLEVKLLSFEESTWKDEDGAVVNPGTSDGKSFSYNHLDITLLHSFKKIDALGNVTTVYGTIRISQVLVNGKLIEIEGPSLDYNTGLYEYTSISRRLNITNKSLVKIVGTVVANGVSYPFEIEGYLSESQNVCGGHGRNKGFDLQFEEVKIVNNKVLVDTKLVNKYKVVGNATKETTEEEYYVDEIKKTYGYDYEVEASGTNTVKEEEYNVTGEASKDIMEPRYSLDVTTETKKYEKIYGTLIVKYVDKAGKELAQAIETTEIVGTDYVTVKKEFEGYEFIEVTGDKTEGKYIDGTLTVIYVYEFVDGKGGDEEPKNVPNTGIADDNALEYITIFSMITLIGAIVIRKKIA